MASHGIARTHRTRTEDQRQQDLDRISKYRHLEDQIRDQVKLGQYSDPALLHLTTKLLRLNPEYYTIWNVRRRCLTSGFLSRPPAGSWPSRASPTTSQSATTRPSCAASSSSSSAATLPDPKSQQPPRDGKSGTTAEGDEFPSAASDAATIKSELAFTIPLLLEFPKCYWIWGYRSFLLSTASSLLPAPQAREFWTAELALDSKMLSKDRRNFHAWSYRRVIVAALESAALGGTSMTEQEFAYTTRMIHDDLSNFSAWHNRSKLAQRLLDERGADDAARRSFLEKELELAREGLNVGPEDQSLWYYHQFLMDQIMESKPKSPGIAPNLGTEDRVALAKKELEEIIELLEDYADVKLVYEALLEYSMALKSIQNGGQVNAGETDDDLLGWLEKLRELDPMRGGRWDDIQKVLMN